MAGRAQSDPFERAAAPVRLFLSEMEIIARSGERTLAEQVEGALDQMSAALKDAPGVSPHAVQPARLAMAVLVDQKARRLKRVRLSTWTAAAAGRLFDMKDITPDTIRRFRDTARARYEEFGGLAEFLDRTLAEIEGDRAARRKVSRRPAVLFFLGSLGLMAALALYAVFLDYRYHARLSEAWAAQAASLPDAVTGTAGRLDGLAMLADQVERAAAHGPLGRRLSRLWNAGDAARATYQEAVDEGLPAMIRDALAEALATEGGSLEAYDTLRTWAVLSGETDFSPAFVAGWLEDRGDVPELGRLVPHALALRGPAVGLAPPESELLDQARGFAAETREPERAFLELKRLDGLIEVPRYRPSAAISGLDDVFTRRTGLALDDTGPALFSEAGWTFARDLGAGVAVGAARREATKLFGRPPDSQNDAPDRVLEILQAETLAHWQDWLKDLRVKPFSRRADAIEISGALAQRNSPLAALLREVWRQAGGLDRLRPHEMQLRIAAAFGPAIQYVEDGRIDEIGRLFASLNVALSTIEFDEEQGAEKLMSVQEYARSVRALASAPTLVQQITEDVLAQTSAQHSSLLSNPLTRQWQETVYPACQRAVAGRYPFGEGGDAALADFTDLFGPRGSLRAFVDLNAARYLDTEGEDWRWKPEARLSGVEQESAQFLQRASAISAAFFPDGAPLDHPFEVAALAEKGVATLTVGSVSRPVRATGDAERLDWPGPVPEAGAEMSLRQGDDTAREAFPGVWGLFRLLDGTRIRVRDQGSRLLIDFRGGGGRLFFEMTFGSEANPFAARAAMRGLTCPPVL